MIKSVQKNQHTAIKAVVISVCLIILVTVIAVVAFSSVSWRQRISFPDTCQLTVSLVGKITLPNSSVDISVTGQLAYITAHDYGLYIVNITDPKKPKIVGSLSLPGIIGDIQIEDTTAYIAAGEMGFYTVDVQEPTNPILVNQTSVEGTVSSIRSSKDRVFVSAWKGGIYIYDIKNPLTPILTANYTPPGRTTDVQIRDSTLYAATAEGKIYILEMQRSGKLFPQEVVTASESPRFAQKLTLFENMLIIETSDGLRIFDISTPNTKKPGWYTTSDNYAATEPVRVFSNRGRLFMISRESYLSRPFEDSELYILDFNNSSKPIIKGAYTLSSNALSLDFDGELIYVVDGSQVQILNVSENHNC